MQANRQRGELGDVVIFGGGVNLHVFYKLMPANSPSPHVGEGMVLGAVERG